MENGIMLPLSTVDYESKDGQDDSEYQLRWTNVMNKGNYKNSENYKSVKALLLRWADDCDDMTTKHEVDLLKDVLEQEFNYHTKVKCLRNNNQGRLQVQVNAIVAKFVLKYDEPNILLMVYYAGHGRPGNVFGHLELHGFVDCTVGLVRGMDRRFEYLAATDSMGRTPVPGEDSFTTALIWALKELKEKKLGGRFTTDELVREIKHNAPNFPKDQKPVLSDRDNGACAGRIILHPLPRAGSDNKISPPGGTSPDLRERHSVTLHLNFPRKPSFDAIERFGEELNYIFERNALGVDRVRWGGIRQSMVGQATEIFLKRCLDLQKQRLLQSRELAPATPVGLPTPSSSAQQSPDTRPFLAQGILTTNPPSLRRATLPATFDSGEDLEEQIQGPTKRRKRSNSMSGGDVRWSLGAPSGGSLTMEPAVCD
ncbi:MAG: hypothetical protein Q9201_003138 [Fulgogasparrea decipioides]